MNRQRMLLLSELGGTWDGIDVQRIPKIETAMTKFAFNELAKHKSRELNEHTVSFVKLIFQANYDNIILFMRYRMYKAAVKKAKLRAKSEGYKMYVVRNDKISYRVISTLEFKINKRIRILDKDLSAKDMEREFPTVYPDGTTNGKGFSGKDIKDALYKPVNNRQAKKKRTQAKHRNIQPIANPKNKKPEDETQEKNERQEKE